MVNENMEFEAIVRHWLDNVRLRVKESSYVKYSNLVHNHILPQLGGVKAGQMTTAVVEEFIEEKLSQGNFQGEALSGKTVKDILTLLKEICRYASYWDVEFPCHFELIRLKSSDRQIRILEKQEQIKLERFLLSDESLTKTGVLLSLYMGLRLGEVCALKKENAINKEEVLKVRLTMQRIQDVKTAGGRRTKIIETEPKSSCSRRDIPIPSFLRNRLSRLEKSPENAYVLTGMPDKFIEPRTMENIFKRYLRECRMADINYHALRHTFATRCIEEGFDVKSLSEILGHSNVNITLNRYVHSSMEQKKKHMERLHVRSLTVTKEKI